MGLLRIPEAEKIPEERRRQPHLAIRQGGCKDDHGGNQGVLNQQATVFLG